MESDGSARTQNGSQNQQVAKTAPIPHLILIDMQSDVLEVFSVVLMSMRERDVSNKPVAVRIQG